MTNTTNPNMNPNPFPRRPDTHGDAWGDTETGRFTPTYEERARRVWEATEAIGLRPEFGGAGSEDGEFVTGARPDGGEYEFLVHLEDPHDQAMIDRAIAKGTLEKLLRAM